MTLKSFVKDPSSKLDYGLDWTNWLLTEPPSGDDSIAASEWASTPSGLTLADPAFDTNTTKVWVSGGASGVTYTLTNTITTALGRIEQRSIEILVFDR